MLKRNNSFYGGMVKKLLSKQNVLIMARYVLLSIFYSQINLLSNFLLSKYFSLTKIYSYIFCSQTNLVSNYYFFIIW
jgi:hypothetical protein